MNFSSHQIPKEYIDKFKATERDKRQLKKFWDNELIQLNKINYYKKMVLS